MINNKRNSFLLIAVCLLSMQARGQEPQLRQRLGAGLRRSVIVQSDGISKGQGMHTVTTNGVQWTYEIVDGGIVLGRIMSICGKDNSAAPKNISGDLVIPDVIEGKPVREIGADAFSGCSGLTSVSISSGVTNIGRCAFYNCKNLTLVTIPFGVTSIGWRAFSGCGGLTSITIPPSVTSIESLAFHGCRKLTSVTIPPSVTSIGWNAFKLTPFYDDIPDGMVILGGGVLYAYKGNCPSRVSISPSMTNVEVGAFNDCTELMSFSVDSNNPSYSSRNGLLCSKDGSTLIAGVNGDVKIPSSVMNIGPGAFFGRRGLTSVTIPSGVTNIGSNAFRDCSGLRSVTIPPNLTEIAPLTFFGCSGLTTITIPSRVVCIGVSAFSGCAELTSVTLPLSVKSIGMSAFSGCRSLSAVLIPSIVTSIGCSAFSGCSALKSVTIPPSVTNIGTWAFRDCRGLASVTIPPSVTNDVFGAFRGCMNLKSVDVVQEGRRERLLLGGMPALSGGSLRARRLQLQKEAASSKENAKPVSQSEAEAEKTRRKTERAE